MVAQNCAGKEQLNEKKILQKIVDGDYNLFTLLYETYVAQLTNYACKLTDDIQIIEDSIHDIFVWLWNHRQQLKEITSIKAYLFKSVRSSIIKKLQQNSFNYSATPHEDHLLNFFISPEEKYIASESHFILEEKIAGAVCLLTSKQKEVIYLRFYQGLSFDEIADNMHLSTKACYKLMGRAMLELRKVCNRSWQAQLIFLLFSLNFVG